MANFGSRWFKTLTPATLAIKVSIVGKSILKVLFSCPITDLHFKNILFCIELTTKVIWSILYQGYYVSYIENTLSRYNNISGTSDGNDVLKLPITCFVVLLVSWKSSLPESKGALLR